MGKPAARAIIDQAAHVGPITIGSLNVLIGGKPAARKGDPITCSAHGVASIIEGSSSVLINGISAARMGDKTSCGTPPTPPPAGPKAAEDDVTYWSPARGSNPIDGTAPSRYPDIITAKPVYAYGGFKDKTGDGSYDQIVGGFAAIDFQADADYTPFGERYGGVGGSGGFNVLKADGVLGAYGSNGIYGAEANAAGSVMSGNAEAHIGKEDIAYAQGEAKGDLGYGEAGADAEGYWGGTESRYGFNMSAVAEAGIARGSVGATGELLGFKLGNSRADQTIQGSDGTWDKKPGGNRGGNYIEGKVGGVGGDIGVGGYIDTDDYQINLKAKLGAELGLGLEVALDITFKYWGWFDFLKPSIIEGTILTGCPTVLIG